MAEKIYDSKKWEAVRKKLITQMGISFNTLDPETQGYILKTGISKLVDNLFNTPERKKQAIEKGIDKVEKRKTKSELLKEQENLINEVLDSETSDDRLLEVKTKLKEVRQKLSELVKPKKQAK